MQQPHKLLKRINLRNSYRAVFSTDDGQRVLQDLMKLCFMYRTTEVPGDAQKSASNEGARKVALHIMAHIHKEDDLERQYVAALNETNS